MFFYGAAYQKSQCAVFMLPKKVFHQLSSEQSMGDVRITQLGWKRVPQAITTYMITKHSVELLAHF